MVEAGEAAVGPCKACIEFWHTSVDEAVMAAPGVQAAVRGALLALLLRQAHQ